MLETEIAATKPTEGLRYVARQPILDQHGQVYGYELLFRAGPQPSFSGNGDVATRTMLDNAVMFGLENLSDGLPAFVNCTSEALLEGFVDVLPVGITVLEILETIEPTPRLIAACRALKNKGYKIALDDFVWQPRFEPLLQIADYVKVDLTLTSLHERAELLKRVHGRPIKMLAEKVETQEAYQQVRKEGFTLFQGYYFCRPILISNRRIPANRNQHFELLQLLQSEDIDMEKASRLMKQSASLTYRLLRLVNSPAYARRAQIHSIEETLLVVGEKTFRHVVMLAIASDLNGKQPTEVLRMAFERGRFCELAAEGCGLDPREQFLLGMLSMLPPMMLMPMEDLAPALPLRDEVQAALKGECNQERKLLSWVESHEKGEWTVCDEIVARSNLIEDKLVACYHSALIWAKEALDLAA